MAKGPRVIDIDVLLYGDMVIHTADLVVPHPGLRERAFVLVPLTELDPDLTDPLTGSPLRCWRDEVAEQVLSRVEAPLGGVP